MRILTWHITSPTAPLPSFYMEQDYTPDKVRIYAEGAPIGQFEVDIKNDGSSIFANQAASYNELEDVDSIIGYNTLAVSTFAAGEEITGGSSGARATVLENSKYGNVNLKLIGETIFTVGETITGGTSSATAVILSFYQGTTHETSRSDPVKTVVILPKGENLEQDAEDFPRPALTITEGSIVSCHVVDMGSANNVTVQLELYSI